MMRTNNPASMIVLTEEKIRVRISFTRNSFLRRCGPFEAPYETMVDVTETDNGVIETRRLTNEGYGNESRMSREFYIGVKPN